MILSYIQDGYHAMPFVWLKNRKSSEPLDERKPNLIPSKIVVIDQVNCHR
jgi:hypothetical protein